MKKIRDFLATLPGFSSSAGFTMIELLVVISVIGILAVAVLSSINPIEQINKGRDTRTRSDAAQLINAVDRYFAIHETYPWNDDFDSASAGVGSDFTAAVGSSYEDAFSYNPDGTNQAEFNWVWHLVSTAEVKQGYVNRLVADDGIIIFKPQGSNTTMYTCFAPTSEAFKFEAQRNCDDGTTPGGTGSTVTPPTGITPCPATPSTTNPNLICLP